MLGAQTAKTERAKVELCGPARPELELPLRDLQCSVITNCLLSKKRMHHFADYKPLLCFLCLFILFSANWKSMTVT